jgi:cell wall-associated NlpC family hydrolase
LLTKYFYKVIKHINFATAMKILVLLFICSISLVSKGYHFEYEKCYLDRSEEDAILRDSITVYAQSQLGVPYVWGGTSSKGFDCTGFVYFVFKKFGIKVSRASSGYEGVGNEIDIANSQAGDIMLFTGTDYTKKKVGHAGIVLKNEDGMVDFIHSSSSKRHFGVTITRYNSSGYEKRFLRVINVIQ